jgi:hypothetical protein
LQFEQYHLGAPRNRTVYEKPSAPLQQQSCDMGGPINVPSPHGLRYCLLVIDHHTKNMWDRILKSKDEKCSILETFMLDSRNIHAKCHSQLHACAPFIKFDSDNMLDTCDTHLMCTQLGFKTIFSAPYAHHMLGNAEHLWRTLRDCASVMLHAMYVPMITWSCAIITVVHLRNRTFSRAVGSSRSSHV